MNNKYIILFSITVLLLLYLEKIFKKLNNKNILERNEINSIGNKTIFVNRI